MNGGTGPLAGLTSGLEMPLGNPGALSAAAGECRGCAAQAEALGHAFQSAIGAAGGWSGQAHSRFVEYTSKAASIATQNAGAFNDAAAVLEQLSHALEHAQQVIKRLEQECSEAQQKHQQAQSEQTAHAGRASDLQNQASAAPHPHAKADLSRQAAQAQADADQAGQAANQAQSQFEEARAAGQKADQAYQQEAQGLAGRLQAAAGQLHPVPVVQGSVPAPIQVSPAAAAFAVSAVNANGLQAVGLALSDPNELNKMLTSPMYNTVECAAPTPETVAALRARYDQVYHQQHSGLEGVAYSVLNGAHDTMYGAYEGASGFVDEAAHPVRTLDELSHETVGQFISGVIDLHGLERNPLEWAGKQLTTFGPVGGLGKAADAARAVPDAAAGAAGMAKAAPGAAARAAKAAPAAAANLASDAAKAAPGVAASGARAVGRAAKSIAANPETRAFLVNQGASALDHKLPGASNLADLAEPVVKMSPAERQAGVQMSMKSLQDFLFGPIDVSEITGRIASLQDNPVSRDPVPYQAPVRQQAYHKDLPPNAGPGGKGIRGSGRR